MKLFTSPEDLWEIVRTLIAERKKREIDPTLTKLRELSMQSPKGDGDVHAHARMTELLELIELLTGWYDDVNQLETARLMQLLSLGSKIQKLIGKADVVSFMTRKTAKKPSGGKDT